MPLQNRVDPFGAIAAVSERGLFMGNRGGRIHDPSAKTLMKRRYASRRWIICECVYKDWHRDVMGHGYTELFFLDEVTALAAGHRPCALCRRAAFNSYRAAGQISHMSADAMDRQLQSQRLHAKPALQDAFTGPAPDGLMVADAGFAYAKKGDRALQWSFGGYLNAFSWPDLEKRNPVLLTPLLSVKALQSGYQPVWHSSASI